MKKNWGRGCESLEKRVARRGGSSDSLPPVFFLSKALSLSHCSIRQAQIRPIPVSRFCSVVGTISPLSFTRPNESTSRFNQSEFSRPSLKRNSSNSGVSPFLFLALAVFATFSVHPDSYSYSWRFPGKRGFARVGIFFECSFPSLSRNSKKACSTTLGTSCNYSQISCIQIKIAQYMYRREPPLFVEKS